MSSVLNDVPDGVNLTGDDYWNPAFRIAANTEIVTRDVSMCSGKFPNHYSLLMKFQLTDTPTKVTLINITSDLGVELAVTIELEKTELFFECQSLMARFPVQKDSFEAGQWHLMSIGVQPTSLSLYIDNKLVHSTPIDSSLSCELTCYDKLVTIGYSQHEVYIIIMLGVLLLALPLIGACTTADAGSVSRSSHRAQPLHLW